MRQRGKKKILWTCFLKVYYKSLSHISNWRENNYNWECFYSNKILCVGWGGNKISFWITNMTNHYLFYVIIAIWEWIVQYFSRYLHNKHCIFASTLLITYKRILHVNKLTWKYNVFMSMTWKDFSIACHNQNIYDCNFRKVWKLQF